MALVHLSFIRPSLVKEWCWLQQEVKIIRLVNHGLREKPLPQEYRQCIPRKTSLMFFLVLITDSLEMRA